MAPVGGAVKAFTAEIRQTNWDDLAEAETRGTKWPWKCGGSLGHHGEPEGMVGRRWGNNPRAGI